MATGQSPHENQESFDYEPLCARAAGLLCTHKLASSELQEAHMNIYVITWDDQQRNAINKSHSVLLDISRTPCRDCAADRKLASGNRGRVKAAPNFEQVQNSNHPRDLAEKVYHVTSVSSKAPACPSRGPEAAKRWQSCRNLGSHEGSLAATDVCYHPIIVIV